MRDFISMFRASLMTRALGADSLSSGKDMLDLAIEQLTSPQEIAIFWNQYVEHMKTFPNPIYRTTEKKIIEEVDRRLQKLLRESEDNKGKVWMWRQALDIVAKDRVKENSTDAEVSETEKLRSILLEVSPDEIEAFIVNYVTEKLNTYPARTLKSKNTVRDISALFVDLEQAISLFPPWQKACWTLELEKYLSKYRFQNKRNSKVKDDFFLS